MNKIFSSIDTFSSRKAWEDACWRKLIKSPKVLQLITTATERHNFVMRVAARERLQAGVQHRQIARELLLSLQTIGVIKKAAQENSYRSYRERGKTERKKRSYTHNIVRPATIRRGKPVKTKYGTIHIP